MPTDRWRRLTILDIAILVASAAVGLWLAGPDSLRWWIGPRPRSAAVLLVGLAIGSVLAVPAVLTMQWAYRGRRERPGPGEALALGSLGVWAAAAVVGSLTRAISPGSKVVLALFIAAIIAQILLAYVACGYLLRRLTPRGREDRFAWTDGFGAVACVLAAVGAWLGVGRALGLS